MTLAIGFLDQKTERAVVAAVREWRAPFNPEDVTREAAELLTSYGVRSVCGDHYAGAWPASRFAAHKVDYRPSERTKSEIYLEALPLFTAGRVELPDNSRLVTQLCSLERKTSRGGRDTCDHPAGGKDDVSNSVCGLLVGLLSESAADGWIRYMRDQAIRSHAPESTPAAPKSDNRPWQTPSSQALGQAGGNYLTDIYDSIRLGLEAPQSQLCKNCGKPVIGARCNDGVEIWHPRCPE
jgi:hypothetical protein